MQTFSGKKIVTMFCKKFNFEILSQKGSHIKLRKVLDGENITVIVPNHSELAVGTFKNILRQARIELADFLSEI
jgi:predicted RNA binding protein YcfA (HicA-like mRNA interferase family)